MPFTRHLLVILLVLGQALGPNMALAEPDAPGTKAATEVIADAEKTLVSDLVGSGPVPITDRQLERFRQRLRKVVDANYVIGLVPSKANFFKFWKKSESVGLKEARTRKVSVQKLVVTVVGLSLLAQVNSAYDLMPITYWLDTNIQNPVLHSVSTGSIETMEFIGAQVVAGANSIVEGVVNTLGTTFSLVFIGGAVGALAVRPQNVLNQKLNVVGGRIFAPFTSWLSKSLDNQTDRVDKLWVRAQNLKRKMKGLPPLSLDAQDGDDQSSVGREALSAVQRLQKHWQSAGLNMLMSNADFTKYLAQERVLWMEFQQKWQNNFTEQQRAGRSSVWEAVYYSPQHFTSLIRGSITASDQQYEFYLKSVERLVSAQPDSADELKALAKKLKAAVKSAHMHKVSDPSKASKARKAIDDIKGRLVEMNADEEDVKHMIERINRSVIARNEAITHLVILLKRDLDYGIFTSDLPDAAYHRLIQIREELGINYYISELREELIALGEEFSLTLKAYEHFIRVYKQLYDQTKSSGCAALLEK